MNDEPVPSAPPLTSTWYHAPTILDPTIATSDNLPQTPPPAYSSMIRIPSASQIRQQQPPETTISYHSSSPELVRPPSATLTNAPELPPRKNRSATTLCCFYFGKPCRLRPWMRLFHVLLWQPIITFICILTIWTSLVLIIPLSCLFCYRPSYRWVQGLAKFDRDNWTWVARDLISKRQPLRQSHRQYLGFEQQSDIPPMFSSATTTQPTHRSPVFLIFYFTFIKTVLVVLQWTAISLLFIVSLVCLFNWLRAALCERLYEQTTMTIVQCPVWLRWHVPWLGGFSWIVDTWFGALVLIPIGVGFMLLMFVSNDGWCSVMARVVRRLTSK